MDYPHEDTVSSKESDERPRRPDPTIVVQPPTSAGSTEPSSGAIGSTEDLPNRNITPANSIHENTDAGYFPPDRPLYPEQTFPHDPQILGFNTYVPTWPYQTPGLNPPPASIAPGEYDDDDDDDDKTVYTAVSDPFRRRRRKFIHPHPIVRPQAPADTEQPPLHPTHPLALYPGQRRRSIVWALLRTFSDDIEGFFSDSLPRMLYLTVLLYLPSFYFSRVTNIFEEVQATLPEMRRMALRGMSLNSSYALSYQSPASLNLKTTWEGFIDSLIREWKTLNIVSVLLLSAIFSMLQIDSASADPITRNAALFSLICSLMSLLYGCIYIIRFSTMRKAYKALEWVQETRKEDPLIWWNPWVLLAMPAAWLAWSLIAFTVAIMGFVWRTSTLPPNPIPVPAHAELAVRIGISVLLGCGLFYFALILNTFRHYGSPMSARFKESFQKMLEKDQMLLKEQQNRQWAASQYPQSVVGGSPLNNYAQSTTGISERPGHPSLHHEKDAWTTPPTPYYSDSRGFPYHPLATPVDWSHVPRAGMAPGVVYAPSLYAPSEHPQSAQAPQNINQGPQRPISRDSSYFAPQHSPIFQESGTTMGGVTRPTAAQIEGGLMTFPLNLSHDRQAIRLPPVSLTPRPDTDMQADRQEQETFESNPRPHGYSNAPPHNIHTPRPQPLRSYSLHNNQPSQGHVGEGLHEPPAAHVTPARSALRRQSSYTSPTGHPPGVYPSVGPIHLPHSPSLNVPGNPSQDPSPQSADRPYSPRTWHGEQFRKKAIGAEKDAPAVAGPSDHRGRPPQRPLKRTVTWEKSPSPESRALPSSSSNPPRGPGRQPHTIDVNRIEESPGPPSPVPTEIIDPEET